MKSGLRLVGLVAAVRIQAALLLPVSVVSCVPAFVGHDLITASGSGLVLFVTMFSALLRGRRPWYEARLEKLSPPSPSTEVVAREDTFDLFSRSLTVPLVLVLVIGLAVGYGTGVPIGAAMAGIGVGMLRQARWLAAQERLLGGWLLCPFTPPGFTASDPDAAAYRESRFWLVRESARG
ncbi:hypothetical protein AB0K43_25965 [Kitasatospora sp. NPDC049258]|uniref:hypothetical protein n=1 Tax=Kitasatospora sp. NPDC049258 TaxID=3155394 RepID=UPI00344A96CC